MFNKKLVAIIVVYLILATAILIGLAQLNWIRYDKLTRRGVVAIARVIQVEPHNHNSLHYTYRIARTDYDGIGSITGSEKPGDTIGIYYVSDEPNLSCNEPPIALLKNETISILLAALLMPAFIIAAFFYRYRRIP